jgi:cobalt-zinc-cadmium efflux system protein
MSNEIDSFDVTDAKQRRVLLIVLVLNLILVVSLLVTGLIANSSGLMANAIDNASDAAVYAISLFAVGRPIHFKRIAATASGVLLLIIVLGILVDAVRRFVTGSEPIGSTMMIMAVIAAIINLVCVKLLERLGEQDVNVRAAQTFSLNDFVANGGVLLAGILVLWTGQPWPDLLVTLGVVAVVAKGGFEILRDARETEK